MASRRATRTARFLPPGNIDDVTEGLTASFNPTEAASHVSDAGGIDTTASVVNYVWTIIWHAIFLIIGFAMYFRVGDPVTPVTTQINSADFSAYNNRSVPSVTPLLSTVQEQWVIQGVYITNIGLAVLALVMIACAGPVSKAAVANAQEKGKPMGDEAFRAALRTSFSGVDVVFFLQNAVTLPLWTALELNKLGEKSFVAAFMIGVVMLVWVILLFYFDSLAATFNNLFMDKLRKVKDDAETQDEGVSLGEKLVNMGWTVAAGMVAVVLILLAVWICFFWMYTQINLSRTGATPTQFNPQWLGAFWALPLYMLVRFLWFFVVSALPIFNVLSETTDANGNAVRGIMFESFRTGGTGKLVTGYGLSLVFCAMTGTFGLCQLAQDHGNLLGH